MLQRYSENNSRASHQMQSQLTAKILTKAIEVFSSEIEEIHRQISSVHNDAVDARCLIIVVCLVQNAGLMDHPLVVLPLHDTSWRVLTGKAAPKTLQSPALPTPRAEKT